MLASSLRRSSVKVIVVFVCSKLAFRIAKNVVAKY